MTMPPPPQQPPGPYGAYPGPQPGPHAAQPSGPYGAQPGFPQQYPGPPGPYGGPMPGPYGVQPPRKKRTGLVVGLVAGGLVLLGCLGYGVKMVVDGPGGASFPAATHKLTVPKTVAGGEYTLAEDMSETEGKKVLDDTYSRSFRTDGAVVAHYTAGSGGTMKAMVVSGIYGQLKNPDTERRNMLEGAATAKDAKVEIPAKDVTPAGSPVTVECEVLTNTSNGITFPMCGWGDDNTVTAIGVVDAASAGQKPEDIDLAAAAELTLKVRSEMRKPL
ncbi:hypothetical protein [Streptomyces sp. NPDC000229]|uniref:hypothetical protein n=1 Tax=Streptomyces sp. NPDC000229 TaxID=3154247 RepID=UPI003323D158